MNRFRGQITLYVRTHTTVIQDNERLKNGIKYVSKIVWLKIRWEIFTDSVQKISLFLPFISPFLSTISLSSFFRHVLSLSYPSFLSPTVGNSCIFTISKFSCLPPNIHAASSFLASFQGTFRSNETSQTTLSR